jgi:hypothetical protein
LLRSTGQRRWPSPDPGGCPRWWIWGVTPYHPSEILAAWTVDVVGSLRL